MKSHLEQPLGMRWRLILTPLLALVLGAINTRPAAPPEVYALPRGSWPNHERGSFVDLVVAGDTAYAAAQWAGLVVLDVADPTRPVLLGGYDTVSESSSLGAAYSLAVHDGLAYVADYFGGLFILDVSVPARPALVSRHIVPGGRMHWLQLDYPYAYAADAQKALLYLYDVSNPFEPALVNAYPAPVQKFRVVAGRAYLCESTRLKIVSLPDPANPHQLGAYTDPVDSGLKDVAIAGTTAFVATGFARLLVLDVANPGSPVKIGECKFEREGARGPEDIRVHGDFAYLACSPESLVVIDVSDPTKPRPAGFYATPRYCYVTAFHGQHALVGVQNLGLHVLDISQPAEPALRSKFLIPGRSVQLDVAAGHAYVADSEDGLQVIDITSPDRPAHLAGYMTGGFGATADDVCGDQERALAYVALAGELRVLDVVNPREPVPLSHYRCPEKHPQSGADASIRTIDVAGNMAVVCGSGPLEILDVGDPRNPVPLRQSAWLWAKEVRLAGSHVFVAHGDMGGLLIYDAANLTARVGEFWDNIHRYDVRGVEISGMHAFLAAARAGLLILDVSDPTQPRLASKLALPGIATAERVQVVGQRAYVAAGPDGVQIIDVSDPTKPRQVGSAPTPGPAYDVRVVEDRMLVAADYYGLLSLRLQPEREPLFLEITRRPSGRIVLDWNVTSATSLEQMTSLPPTVRWETPRSRNAGRLAIPNSGQAGFFRACYE